MTRIRRRHTVTVAGGAPAVAGMFGAAPAAATVTGQGDVRTFGDSILVILQNIDSTTDTRPGVPPSSSTRLLGPF